MFLFRTDIINRKAKKKWKTHLKGKRREEKRKEKGDL
jgi:hypothetical protein